MPEAVAIVAPQILPRSQSVNESDRPALRLVGWLVQPGDAVSAGERLAELTFPGVLVYATALVGGTLTETRVQAGQTTSPGDVLGWIHCKSEDAVTNGNPDD